MIGFAGGTIQCVAAILILLKNIEVTGLHWGAYAQHQPQSIPEVFQALFALYERGAIRPVVFRTYPLEEVTGRPHGDARGAGVAGFPPSR